jgi:hypothetical protein
MDNYILLRVSEVDAIEKSALEKKENNKDRPMSEAMIEAETCLSMIKWIRDNNLYTKSLGCDEKYKKGKR